MTYKHYARIFLLFLSLGPSTINSFSLRQTVLTSSSSSTPFSSLSRISSSSSTRTTTSLRVGNLFDDFRNFFSRNDNEKNKEQQQQQQQQQQGNAFDKNDDLSSDMAAGTVQIASIPVKSIKPGGLRLFLMFYCMGMQNSPDPKSWRANQPSAEDYVVEMYFHDASAMMTIELTDDEVMMTRCGSLPSTAYLMQESVIVQGVLDELEQCAFDESVDAENRLLILKQPDGIDIARSAIAFG